MPQRNAKQAVDAASRRANSCAIGGVAGCFTLVGLLIGLLFGAMAITGNTNPSNAQVIITMAVSGIAAAAVAAVAFRFFERRGVERPTQVTMPDGSSTQLRATEARDVTHSPRRWAHAARPALGGLVAVALGLGLIAGVSPSGQSARDLVGLLSVYILMAGVSGFITAVILVVVE
jgi:hypothetical protein